MKTPQRDEWLCYRLPENLCIHDALIARAPNMKELGWQGQFDRKASKGLSGDSPLHGSGPQLPFTAVHALRRRR